MFLSDKEKMFDLCGLTKEEFLFSYSYLSEGEYIDTIESISDEWINLDDETELNLFNVDGTIYYNFYRVSDGNIDASTPERGGIVKCY